MSIGSHLSDASARDRPRPSATTGNHRNPLSAPRARPIETPERRRLLMASAADLTAVRAAASPLISRWQLLLEIESPAQTRLDLEARRLAGRTSSSEGQVGLDVSPCGVQVERKPVIRRSFAAARRGRGWIPPRRKFKALSYC